MGSVRVVVHGRVQGVGYRWYVRAVCEAADVRGWVRNRSDGAVEAELYGDDAAVALVLAALRDGPPQSRVDDLAVTEIPPSRATAFEIRPTA